MGGGTPEAIEGMENNRIWGRNEGDGWSTGEKTCSPVIFLSGGFKGCGNSPRLYKANELPWNADSTDSTVVCLNGFSPVGGVYVGGEGCRLVSGWMQ